MSTNITTTAGPDITSATWHLDPTRSSVAFHVRHFWGLMTVKGRFHHYEGTLNLQSKPAIELTIDADSLDTGHAKRDTHLRSSDFFDVANHPQVKFVAETASVSDGVLSARGELHAAGRHVPLDIEATLRQVGDELEVEATAVVDHRTLGMTWSPLGILRPPRLIVRGRLVKAEAARWRPR